jgi:hypothetical protein
MRVLFDQATPVPIRKFLIGHTVRTAAQEHWDRLKNGDLLAAAEHAGFDVFLTTDKNLQYQQNFADNLLQQTFTAERPNQRWVGDTTELVIGESGKLYLAVILDLFSRFVVGWAVSACNDRHLTIKALEMALKRRCPEIGLLHHSDQGSTYASRCSLTSAGAIPLSGASARPSANAVRPCRRGRSSAPRVSIVRDLTAADRPE